MGTLKLGDAAIRYPLYLILKNPRPGQQPDQLTFDGIARVRIDSDASLSACVFTKVEFAEKYMQGMNEPDFAVAEAHGILRMLKFVKAYKTDFVVIDPAAVEGPRCAKYSIDRILRDNAGDAAIGVERLFIVSAAGKGEPQRPKITGTVMPNCAPILKAIAITPGMVTSTVNEPDRKLVSGNKSRFAAIRWLDNDRIVLIDSRVTGKSEAGEITTIEVSVVLELRSELPAGRIDRSQEMDEILAIVAESFGDPMRCHPDEPYSTVYNGQVKIEGRAVALEFDSRRNGAVGPPSGVLGGNINVGDQWAEMVWFCNYGRYLDWFKSLQAS